MAIVTGDRYLDKLVRFVNDNAGPLIDGTLVLKLNPAGLHYVQSRLEALGELESLLSGAPVDYLRAYVSDLGDHRAIEQLRRILRLLTSLKVVSVLPPPARDPTPLSLVPFGRLRVLELRGCDLSSSDAKGLLELRHTLERIVCHNSTDALRHVFANRIADIMDCPQWNRLSFVSCACNGLLLMDESLQLLPAVETLDLSRNKFTKVDNLRKCVKLKHLDLGFNNLRSVSSFSQVSCGIVKLVLRNNALTTLHGIENLKSLEDLDVSYNIISNFSELEFLVGLPSLRSLWLEGNPLCCAGWYRAQAFSYISHPERFKLDDKEISTREFWKRQLIIASRQKRPASFGFYSPIYDAKGEGSSHRRRRKNTRLASIGGEGESSYLCSDQDSVSVDNEVQSREENAVSDDDAEIVDLMNKVELMKKERSVLWLREFNEWMDHASSNSADHGKHGASTFFPGLENVSRTKLNEVSRDETGMKVLDSDSLHVDVPSGLRAHQYLDQIGLIGTSDGVIPSRQGRRDLKDERPKHSSARGESSVADSFSNQPGYRMIENVSLSPLTTIDSFSESHSSAPPGSPPYYRKDILKRRQCLEEEILQLSADSYSVASSDSITSCSEDDDDAYDFGPMSDVDQLLNENAPGANRHLGSDPRLEIFEDKSFDKRHQISPLRNGQCSADHFADKTCRSSQSFRDDGSEASEAEIHRSDEESDLLNDQRGKRKVKRRVISLLPGNNIDGNLETSQKSNENSEFRVMGAEKERESQYFDGSRLLEVYRNKQMVPNMDFSQLNDETHVTTPSVDWLFKGSDDFIEKEFNSHIADSRIYEVSRHYIRCCCILQQDFECRERDVALVLSSEKKLYVLLIGPPDDKSGTTLRLLACHRIQDVREILVGMGLQVLRVSIERGLTYLFMTRSVEKSTQLLYLLEVFGLRGTDHKCCLESLEHVQVNLFEKEIFGGSKVSIFQYAMVLFSDDNNKVTSWLPRSLFVAGVHLLLCVEDLKKFGSLSTGSPSLPYFSLDSYCSITDISELVVDAKEIRSVTLTLTRATSVHRHSGKAGKGVEPNPKATKTSSTSTWKLKWFSEDGLSKFVMVVKAIHAGTNTSPVPIRYIS